MSCPLDLAKEDGRYEDLATILEERTAGLDNQVANGPPLIIQ
jgi:hypothetical protein